jgi:tRNA(fMet)-specific endonuclease VapC
MHILDTDTLTHLQKGNEKVKLRLLQANDFEFAITIITKAEILRGRIEFLLKADNADTLVRAQRFLLESENLLE